MTTVYYPTVADLLERLGDIPPERVRLVPAPGHATGEDVLRVLELEDRLCELVDGVLVEKPMGWYESTVAAALIFFLKLYLRDRDLGVLSGPDGPARILPDRIRIPDVAFYLWHRFPDRKRPRERIPALVPDLAVEILSESNSPAEMDEKVEEYFRAGVSLVWLIDPASASARVFNSPADGRDAEGVLDGGRVLPGFRLGLAELFANAGPRP